MTPLTPETLVRHELIGLRAAVVDATNPGLVGIDGRIVGETTQTLRIETNDRVKTVPKRGATFAFALPDDQHVTVEGRLLVARPARRTETTGGSIWQSA